MGAAVGQCEGSIDLGQWLVPALLCCSLLQVSPSGLPHACFILCVWGDQLAVAQAGVVHGAGLLLWRVIQHSIPADHATEERARQLQLYIINAACWVTVDR